MSAELYTIIGSIIAVSTLITGSAVWITRRIADNIEKSISESKTSMSVNMTEFKSEFKEFSREIDRKLDGINLHFDQKLESVNSFIRDVSSKTDKIKDRLHEAELKALKTQTDLQDKFVTTREVEELQRRLDKLEKGQ